LPQNKTSKRGRWLYGREGGDRECSGANNRVGEKKLGAPEGDWVENLSKKTREVGEKKKKDDRIFLEKQKKAVKQDGNLRG